MNWDVLNRLPMNRGSRHWWRSLGPCRYCGSYTIFCTSSILTLMHFCSWKCEVTYWNTIQSASGYTPDLHVEIQPS